MHSIRFNRPSVGLPPGTPVYVGDRPAADMELSVLVYGADSAAMHHLESVDVVQRFSGMGHFTWININGLKDIDSIKQLASAYQIHPLTVEDILNTEQPPKAELFDHYRFISIKSMQLHPHSGDDAGHSVPHGNKNMARKKQKTEPKNIFLFDQISIIIMERTLITFQEIPGDSFGNIRKRILENIGHIRGMGMDYLAYSILDAVIDEYYLALLALENEIEQFEDRAVETSDSSFTMEIQGTKKLLLKIKRAMLPLRDILGAASRGEEPLLDGELKPFLQDLRENLNNAIDTVESSREWLVNIMDVKLSVLSHQMNKVMKTLAVISTIFIPLTFIAGVYGMNFENMPELSTRWGYPIVLGGMAVIALIMLLLFKRRRWF